MQKITFKTNALIFIVMLVVAIACQKRSDLQVENIASLQDKVEEAKAWFANGPVLREKKFLELPFSTLPEKSPQRVFARMGKMQARLQWDNAEHYKRDGLDYLIVPVMFDTKIFGKEYDFAKVVVFNKNRAGDMNVSVLEILSKKGTSLGGRQMEIAATAFYNRELNKKDLLTGINAFVFFYDENYKKQSGFELIDGTWSNTNTTLKVGKNKQNTAANNYTESGNCDLWGFFLDTYDGNGVLLYSELLYTYWVGDCSNGPGADPNESGDPGDGGGGGDGAVDQVINLLEDPCKNAALNAISSIGITNTISQFYNAVSSSSSPITIVFTESNNINGGGSAVTIPMGNNIYHTTLSNASSYSSAVMSQEAWGAILAHEILHVFILNGGLGNVAPGNYSHHTAIFTSMINTTSSLLHNAFGLDNAIATRLALNGLADLWTFGNFDSISMSQYGYTLAQIEATLVQYSMGGLGTRCN